MSTRPRPIPQRLAERIEVDAPGRIAPLAARLMDGWLGSLVRALYRPTFSGWEHMPEEGPVLIVANHSGCGGVEVLALALLWREHFGDARPATGMAHPAAWFLPGVATAVSQLGAIPSTREAGLGALTEARIPVLIFPGGDYEAFRPVWRAEEVDFNGRQGFLRLARDAGVPIVPLGIRGSHYTAPVLWRSELLAWLLVIPRLLGAKRMPLTLFAVLGAGALLALVGPLWGWGWAAVAVALWMTCPLSIWSPIVPWPIHARLGPPLAPEALFGPEDDRRPLEGCYDEVVAEVQRLVVAP